jgi:hypothetical protein
MDFMHCDTDTVHHHASTTYLHEFLEANQRTERACYFKKMLLHLAVVV